MELWDDQGFGIVGKLIGNPLFIDKLVEERKHTNYARICIEIDTRCEYPNSLTIVVDRWKA